MSRLEGLKSTTRAISYDKDVFAKWEFVNGDFETLSLATDDFVYADPPYDVELHYSSEGFNWQDQVRLQNGFPSILAELLSIKQQSEFWIYIEN